MKFYYHKLSVRIGLAIIGLGGLCIMFLISINYKITLFAVAYTLLGCCILIEVYAKRVFINAKGVIYKSVHTKYKIEWQDIKHIDVRGINLGRGRINALCFTKEYISTFDIEPKYMTNDFILMLNINKKVIREVTRYWDGKIGGLEQLSNDPKNYIKDI